MTDKKAQTTQLLCERYLETGEAREGAQATVRKAFDVIGSREVAIKRMDVGRNAAKSSEGFRREAASLEDLVHENIVELVEVNRDETDGTWFLVLEWIPETLEDVIKRTGPMSWPRFWDQFGSPLLNAIIYAQSRKWAHRDIKPRNILMTAAGVAKLADYGIAKFVDLSNAWSVDGTTLRFDYTPGYTPTLPEDPIHNYSKDCFGFAAVAISCLTGTIHHSDDELQVAAQEAPLPSWARSVMESCISSDPHRRPAMASVLLARLEEAESAASSDDAPRTHVHLLMSQSVRARLDRALGLDSGGSAEAAVIDELAEGSALLFDGPVAQGAHGLQIIGTEWTFKVAQTGRNGDALELVSANEVGAALASDLRDQAARRPLAFSFGQAADRETAGRQLSMLVADAHARHSERSAERAALAEQRVFKVWRSYLRDRADLEAKRKNAIKYVDRVIAGETVIFTTELVQNADIVGQDRIVTSPGGRLTGRITTVAFNRLAMEIASGDPSKTPRRGEIAINTIAAQRALDVQGSALDAVVYGRAVNPGLKQLILDPKTATAPQPVREAEADEKDFDPEKTAILKTALGVQDVLTIEGPPGTGKTKLITEIVVQWLRRNPSHRILLASQTHIAIDNVIERVAEVDPDLDIIRIGRPDEPRISDFGKTLLLESRVETWISDVKAKAEAEMSRWARSMGIDRSSIELGMKVERLIRVIELQRDLRDHIARQQDDLSELTSSSGASEEGTSDEAADAEDATELDSEIAAEKRVLRMLVAEEEAIRTAMLSMGSYAAELSASRDAKDLGDWTEHLLPAGDAVDSCRQRLALLEDWTLRVGRSNDFNAAMLSAAQIIAGTCIGVSGVRGMQEVEYDLCIVDEASKATPTEIISPMARCRRWIIVGDPKQLPPFFEEFGEQLKSDVDIDEVKATLMDRFLKDGVGLPQANRAKLTNQYRMITPIGNLISHCFYQDELVSPITTHGLRLGSILPKPIVWRSTHLLPKHGEQVREETFFNSTEIQAVRAELKRLQFVGKAQGKRMSVAVIAGYTAQVADLRDMISQGIAEWSDLDVECNTVDAFQGRQADICIYSIVRSNPRRDLGFLREQPRLNVALSRGKSALIIVGDFVFCRGIHGRNPFRQVVEYFDQHEDDCLVDILS